MQMLIYLTSDRVSESASLDNLIFAMRDDGSDADQKLTIVFLFPVGMGMQEEEDRVMEGASVPISRE